MRLTITYAGMIPKTIAPAEIHTEYPGIVDGKSLTSSLRVGDVMCESGSESLINNTACITF